MRQKVGIAIALAKRARALLLDEPTSRLDPIVFGRQSVREVDGSTAPRHRQQD